MCSRNDGLKLTRPCQGVLRDLNDEGNQRHDESSSAGLGLPRTVQKCFSQLPMLACLQLLLGFKHILWTYLAD